VGMGYFPGIYRSALSAALAVLAATSACAPESSKKVIKECVLPADQAKTLSGKWKLTPVPISLKAGEFTSDEAESILRAADVWNAFFKASMGIQVLDYGDRSSPRTSSTAKPANMCSQNYVQGDKFVNSVVIYRQTSWPYSNHNAIALTSFCPVSDKPLPRIQAAIMEVNYQDFFGNKPKQPDLQSIFIHEFGHLVGLDHSCEAKTKEGYPNCNDPGMPPDYFYAVMFPVILFDTSGVGEQRRDLMDNDEGRANCLYQQ
jgi:hypothetical protein